MKNLDAPAFALSLSILVSLCACGTGPADERVSSADSPPAPREDPETSPPAARIGLIDLLAELGVAWFPDERRLEVSGWVNLQEGAIEVFACAPGGKTHESVLVLDCAPHGVHAGLLALGLSPGAPALVDENGEWAPPSGDGVVITVRWADEEGAAHEVRAEDWVFDESRGASMERTAWIFTGSREADAPGETGEPTYAADLVRSLITTYHDRTSILENPRATGANDEAYRAHHEVLPESGTEVVVVLSAASEEE